MEIITATTIFLASLNVYGECGFAYSAETSEDGIVTAKTVYRKSVCGKYLSPTLKYNYVYDGEQRLAQKEVLKWNGVTGEWDKSHILNYMYDENGYAIEYAVWNSGKKKYADVVAKQTYNEGIDGALYIALYKWDDSGNDWEKQNDMVAMNLSGELLTSFEFEL